MGGGEDDLGGDEGTECVEELSEEADCSNPYRGFDILRKSGKS